MISIQLQSGDLENIRFAFSPLLETSMSYCGLRKPDHTSAVPAWSDEAERALYGIEFPYMDAAILGKHYVADFVTPTPTTTQGSFEDDLSRLWDTPDAVIRRNMEVVIAHSEETEIRRHFLVNPHDALDCLVAEIRLYWQLTLKHHWPQITSVLEGDILYQARQLALNGADTMFSSLSPHLRYSNSEIVLEKSHFVECPQTFSLDGDGLQLVPSIFGGEHVSWQIVPEWRPMVIYGARGVGLWYRRELPEPEKALELALGAARAQVLHALQTPTPTGELARQLQVTAGAISQQLQRLQKAGLVESHRNSNKVYYRLTSRGENLLDLFTAS